MHCQLLDEKGRTKRAEEELARQVAALVEVTRVKLELQGRVQLLHDSLEKESARSIKLLEKSKQIRNLATSISNQTYT